MSNWNSILDLDYWITITGVSKNAIPQMCLGYTVPPGGKATQLRHVTVQLCEKPAIVESDSTPELGSVANSDMFSGESTLALLSQCGSL
jgi:hypothetical protein